MVGEGDDTCRSDGGTVGEEKVDAEDDNARSAVTR
jgi:hypothetical protein